MTVLDLQPGAKVKLRKPADTRESPVWISTMDSLNGKTVEVAFSRALPPPAKEGTVIFFAVGINGLSFNANWAEPVQSATPK